MFRALLSCFALYLCSAIAAGNAQAQCAAYTTASGPTTFCQGSTGTSLSTNWYPLAACTASAYQWQIKSAGVWTNISGATSATYAPTATGFYHAQITVTSSSVPVTSDSIYVTVNPAPLVTFSHPSSIQICAGSGAYLCATSSGSVAYQWYLNGIPIVGAIGSCYTATFASTYTCVAYSAAMGCSGSASTTITLIPLPPAPTVVTPVNYCQYDTALPLAVSAIPGSFILWYSVATGGLPLSIAPTPITSSPGTWNIWVSQTMNGCESPRAQITVNVHAKPPAPGASANTRVCAGSTLQLATSTSLFGASYSWTGPNGFVSGPNTTGNAVRANTTALAAGRYYATIVTAQGCSSTDSVLVAVTCLDSVWPGDANYDKIVDNLDALEIALAMGSTGPARPSGVSISWQPEFCVDWLATLPSNSGINRKHADCDGDSTVTLNDTMAVTVNYGLTHPKSIRSTAKITDGLPDLYFDLSGISPSAGKTISVPIKLGTSATPMTSIAGVAARVMIEGVTPSDTPSLSYAGSWLGPTTMQFSKAINSNRLDWAQARTDQQNSSGSGTIAWLSFTLPARAQGEQLRLFFDEVVIVDSSGKRFTDFNSLEDTLTILPMTTGISPGWEELDNGLMVMPNPSSGASRAQFRMAASGEYKLELHDLSGKLIWHSSGKGAAGLQLVRLPESALRDGVYLLSLLVDGKAIAHVRWVRK